MTTTEERIAAIRERARSLPTNDGRRVRALHELSEAAGSLKIADRRMAIAEAALAEEPRSDNGRLFMRQTVFPT